MSVGHTLIRKLGILALPVAAIALVAAPRPADAQYYASCAPGYYYDPTYGCLPYAGAYAPDYYGYVPYAYGGWGGYWGGGWRGGHRDWDRGGGGWAHGGGFHGGAFRGGGGGFHGG